MKERNEYVRLGWYALVVMVMAILTFGTPAVRVAAQAIQQVVLHVGTASSPTAVAHTNGVLQSIVNSITPGTAATNLGKAEDAGHVTGDTGVATFGVRNEAAAQLSGADADYTPQAVDAYGALFARSDHPNRIRCTVTVSTATTIQAVGGSCAAPGAGLSIYLTDILFSASAAGIAGDAFPTLKYGTGGTCGSGTTVFWGALTAAAIVLQDNRTMPIKIPANNEVCWISSTAGSKFLVLGGFIAP